MSVSERSEGRRSAADRIAFDELRLAIGNITPNKWLIPLVAAILCGVFWNGVPHARLLLWYGAVLLALVPMSILSRRFLALEPFGDELKRWRVRIVAANGLFTCVWGAMGAVMWVHGQQTTQMIVLLVLCCSLAADAALVSAYRALSNTGTICYGSLLVALPLIEGGTTYYWLAGATFVFVIYMYHLSGQMNATARAMLTLREDKNDLIEALASSKAESDVARDRALAANRAKSEFLANMSHELRTPLNAILGFSEMITTGVAGRDPGRHEEYAGMIHESGHLLLALINDILDLAKIEAGSLMLREAEIDMARLAEECARLMSAKAAQGNLEIRLEFERNLPPVRGDERALKQIILNLLSNALKFSPPGESVTLFAQTEPGGEFAFGVDDSGIGIAEEDHEHVFQNFGQGRHDVVTPEKGTGLGLPIVMGLAKAHGGRVQLKSAPGEGTCVTVYLPPDRICARRPPLRAVS